MDQNMTTAQFNELKNEITAIRRDMVTKGDVFQVVFTVMGLFAAAIVGTVVVLNATGQL